MLDLQIRNLERGLMIIKLALDATRHVNLDYVQRDQDDLIYKHFWGGGDIADWRISRYSSLTESVMRRN